MLGKSWQASRLDAKPAVSLQFSLVLSLLMIMENMLVLFDDVMRRKDQAGSGSFKGFSFFMSCACLPAARFLSSHCPFRLSSASLIINGMPACGAFPLSPLPFPPVLCFIDYKQWRVPAHCTHNPTQERVQHEYESSEE
jgi:hypothetical protein